MAKSSPAIIGALQFLTAPGEYPPGSICVITGEEPFLCHEVRTELVREIASVNSNRTDADGLILESFEGRIAEFSDVADALRERSLFGGGRRVVLVEEADSFVKKYRESLEQYLEKPVRDALLVLEVKTWPGNTRLAKAVAKCGLTIRCQVPQQGRELTTFTKELKDWLVQVALRRHQVELKRPAVDLLLDLLPTEVGILCQEIAKLALLTGDKAVIDTALVRNHVGGWRTRKTWDMIDAAAEGKADDALDQLDRLIAAGEEPHALLPQMASTLRRFASAVRCFEQAELERRSMSLRAALQESGLPPFKLSAAEGQLRQLGRPRAKQLYHWLLAADLELKGHNSTKDRARRVLETLIVRLSKQTAAASSAD